MDPFNQRQLRLCEKFAFFSVIALCLFALRLSLRAESIDPLGAEAAGGTEGIFERPVTSVAVARDGRVFAGFSERTDRGEVALAEVGFEGDLTPFPNAAWNVVSGEVATRWLAVRSVYVDAAGFLWVLDAPAMSREGATRRDAKLVKIDLATDRVVQTFVLDPQALLPQSQLADVRVDTRNQFAVVADSGDEAAVVVNLRNGRAWRLELGRFRGEGYAGMAEGSGLALAMDDAWIYFSSLRGRASCCRVALLELENTDLDPERRNCRLEASEIPRLAENLEARRQGVFWASREEPWVREEVAMKIARVAGPTFVLSEADRGGRAGSLYLASSAGGPLPRLSRGLRQTREPCRVFQANYE